MTGCFRSNAVTYEDTCIRMQYFTLAIGTDFALWTLIRTALTTYVIRLTFKIHRKQTNNIYQNEKEKRNSDENPKVGIVCSGLKCKSAA